MTRARQPFPDRRQLVEAICAEQARTGSAGGRLPSLDEQEARACRRETERRRDERLKRVEREAAEKATR